MFKACVLVVDGKLGNLFINPSFYTRIFSGVSSFVHKSGFSTFFTHLSHRVLRGLNIKLLLLTGSFPCFTHVFLLLQLIN